VDDLIAFLRARLDEDEEIANRWLFDFGDRRRWKVVGGRRLSYANGAGQNVTAIDVDNASVLFNEQIYVMSDLDGQSEHVARHDPARVLAEVDAKRRIIDLHHPDKHLENWYWDTRKCAECGHRWHQMTPPGTPPTVIGPATGCPTLRLLALPHAGHPDCREEWKP
jgi:hypothetical protein